MKITSKELISSYKSHIKMHVPASREGCPSEENLLRVFQKSLSSRKKERIIDHVVKCAYCLQEFEFLLGLWREENKAAKEVSEWIRQKSQCSKPPWRKLKIWRFVSRSSVRQRPQWRLAAISLAFLLIVALLLVSIRTIFKPALDEERGRFRDQVRLTSPAKGQTITRPLIFRWQGVIQAQLYHLEIFDETLLSLWKSPAIDDIIFELPPEVSAKIEENKVYFWMVTAILPGGARRESELETFILKEPPAPR